MATEEPVQLENMSEAELSDHVHETVLQEMRLGTEKSAIVGKLVEQGMDADAAAVAVELNHARITADVAQEQFSMLAVGPAIVGGGLAALLGGAVWAMIAIATDYELGLIAWGIGVAAGLGVVMFARGRRGVVLQGIAVGASVFGILVGKYFIFRSALIQYFEQEAEAGVTIEIAFYSRELVELFFQSLPDILGGYDILWVILAVASAWKIPAPTGIALSSSES